ncbi:flagellar basal body-associated FliL family protein [Plastorhodobacter daqingensis]|uniref:Flagellar protein FliL n=1 Tax=Plastorhodobacter daqingensis TaxID=1387281 RepID=A0ABW2UGK0_9RHOB
MRKLLPVLLAITGLGIGIAGGLLLRTPAAPDDPLAVEEDTAAPTVAGETQFMPLSSQFVVPLVENGRVQSMVVLSLSLEIAAGSLADLQAREPKLRDSFLQVMFDHANAGGFRGNFTTSSSMQTLREALREAARKQAGPAVRDVLISDILRQDS